MMVRFQQDTFEEDPEGGGRITLNNSTLVIELV